LASEDVSELIGHPEPHRDHTPYAERLAEGRSIGSGLVEGACKTAIGRRLKQTGACWRIRRLKRMATLSCLHYSDQFDAYWGRRLPGSDQISLPHPQLIPHVSRA
jgi:hypothetical protein